MSEIFALPPLSSHSDRTACSRETRFFLKREKRDLHLFSARPSAHHPHFGRKMYTNSPYDAGLWAAYRMRGGELACLVNLQNRVLWLSSRPEQWMATVVRQKRILFLFYIHYRLWGRGLRWMWRISGRRSKGNAQLRRGRGPQKLQQLAVSANEVSNRFTEH